MAAEPLRAQLVVLGVAGANASGGSLVVPGPEWIVLLGVAVPLFSAGAGVLGVVLGQLLAPAPATPIGWGRRAVLLATLIAIVVASVIATGQQVIVALSWGIGLGYSGQAVAETLAAQAKAGIKTIGEAASSAIVSRIGGGKKGSDT